MSTVIGIEGLKKSSRYTREYKGNSLLEFAGTYTVVDIETTGLDPRYDEIIEIGAVRVVNHEIVEEFSSLVNPRISIDDFIIEKTGITNEMLENAPCIDEVLPDLKEFLDSSIIIGHNVNFDINFLYDNFMEFNHIPLTNNFIDTLRLSRWLFKDMKSHRLDTLCKEFKLSIRDLHRAVTDCYYTKDIYDYMRQHIEHNNIDIDELFKKKRHSSRKNASKKRLSSSRIDVSLLISNNTELDETHPLFGKNIVFTGKLEKMLRKDAAQLATNFGAVCQNSVTKTTNILVLGNNDYCPHIKDGKSSKQKKAEQYILKGNDLIVISENVFYDMVLEE